MKKVIYLFFLIASCWSCSSNSTAEKYQDKRDNIINVHNQIKEIVIEDVLINNYSWPQIIDEYIFITDYKTADEFIHILNKNNFRYITSTALRGQGPGEITRLGHIAEDKENHKFYALDHGKRKIFSFDLDSVISDPAYLPVEKMILSKEIFPSNYIYINDTLSIGVNTKPIGDNDFISLVGKINMKTGEIKPMNYMIHPNVKKKRIWFSISLEHGIYVECYMPHDLMTICDLDGNLKYNIYGPNWDTEIHGKDYFGDVHFCNDKIVACYSGEQGFRDGKSTYPTKFMLFDLDGNYLKTLETGYPIIRFCYDKDNNRIIMSLNDAMQFAYLDLGKLLD
ncbi:6-bladed beta-propeller [Parabacteroides sp.]|uniref:6-bladed beta-propeller n=1 Tax=Parabacteroides sp. TaxID=1869337 RepID=UPI00257D8954|nr:6-bladed beta-propeller [Parabacteroides sp.]